MNKSKEKINTKRRKRERKKMKSDRKTLAVILMAIALILTVGYSLLTQQLDITGQATIRGSGWDIRFTNLLTSPTIVGTAEEVDPPTLNASNTVISDIDVKFFAPGDAVIYTFDIANAGAIDAEITDIVKGTVSCTSQADPDTSDPDDLEADETNVCNNIIYTLTYKDSGDLVAIGDVLEVGDSVTVELKITYPAGSTMPALDVLVTNITYAIIYSQVTS